MKRRWGAAVMMTAALLAGPAPVAAQAAAAPSAAAKPSPKAEALVRRFFAATHIEQTVDTMMSAVLPMMSQTMLKQYPGITDEQRGMINDIVRQAMREDFTPKMIDRMVPIYAQTFSEPELEAMVAFYESEAGQAIMRKTPTLAPKSAAIAQELVPELQTEMVRRLCAKIDCSGSQAAAPKPRPS